MRPKPSVALTVPKVVSRLEISSAVIDVVRPEMMSLLVIGVSESIQGRRTEDYCGLFTLKVYQQKSGQQVSRSVSD